jgi:hypothetical protein
VILQAKPGITGLSQLAFGRERELLDPADRLGDYLQRFLPQMIALDRTYVAPGPLRDALLHSASPSPEEPTRSWN